jgi:tetratricopeptide (TPR) repeat protein
MKVRAWRLIAALAAAIVLVIGLYWWLLRPHPSLDGVDRLMAAGRYDAADARLLDYLRAYPRDQVASVMLARASVERPDPKPEQALEQIKWFRPPDRHWSAVARSIEGEARFLQRRYDLAETMWLEALRLDPRIGEVGWGLLSLYALQGRDEESRLLGLRLHTVEPDPHDRVMLLVQLIRHDAHAISVDSVVNQLEPVVRDNPADLHSTLALGRALVKSGRTDEGLDLLRRAVTSHKDDPHAWEVYLNALGDAGQIDALMRALEQLPASLTGSAQFDAARGWVAAQRRDWAEAARAYRSAWEARPSDVTLGYRLDHALRAGGQHAELEQLAPRLRAITAAREKLRGLYDQIDALPDLGRVPRLDLYEEVAAALEPLGRNDEARAWRRLAHGEPPDAPESGFGKTGLARP